MYLGKVRNEGVAIFLQLIDFAMRTNCAPSWAQLILRAYEKRSPLPRDIMLWKYIDDGFALYPLSLKVGDPNTFLSKVYPPHHTFTFENTTSRCGVVFLEDGVVSLASLRTSVSWR